MHALLIDIGNTSLKLALSGPDALITSYTLPTDTTQSGDSLGLQVLRVLEHTAFDWESLSAVLICSVVPGMDPLLRHACERYLGIVPKFAHRDVPVPLENRYEQPMEVGADRLVAAYAARKLFPDARSVVSVDYGTATTFDCVTGKSYLGGLICPGVMSSLRALAVRTAQLPQIALSNNAESPIVCRSTVTSLNHGFLFGFAAMTEGLIDRLLEKLEGPTAVVATGGFAQDISKIVKCFDFVRPELIMEGLRLMWVEQECSTNASPE